VGPGATLKTTLAFEFNGCSETENNMQIGSTEIEGATTRGNRVFKYRGWDGMRSELSDDSSVMDRLHGLVTALRVGALAR
jgi:hypothetical protein